MAAGSPAQAPHPQVQLGPAGLGLEGRRARALGAPGAACQRELVAGPRSGLAGVPPPSTTTRHDGRRHRAATAPRPPAAAGRARPRRRRRRPRADARTRARRRPAGAPRRRAAAARPGAPPGREVEQLRQPGQRVVLRDAHGALGEMRAHGGGLVGLERAEHVAAEQPGGSRHNFDHGTPSPPAPGAAHAARTRSGSSRCPAAGRSAPRSPASSSPGSARGGSSAGGRVSGARAPPRPASRASPARSRARGRLGLLALVQSPARAARPRAGGRR